MALTSVSALKLHLGLAGESQDAFLAQLLGAVEQAFLTLIDRRIEEQEYTQYLGGDWTPVLLLPEYPVASVSDVRVDDRGFWGQHPDGFGAATALTLGADYVLVKDGAGGATGDAPTGRLYRAGGVWPGRMERPPGLLTPRRLPGAGNVRASYVAGYSAVPADIPLALWQVAAQLRQTRSSGYLTFPQSERFEDYAISNAVVDATRLLQVGGPAQVVAKYRRITPRYQVLG